MNWRAIFYSFLVGTVVMSLFWFGLSCLGFHAHFLFRFVIDVAAMYGILSWFDKRFPVKNEDDNV